MKPHLTLLTYWLRLRSCPQYRSSLPLWLAAEAGLTLLESLVAIVVLMIILGFIAAPITMSIGGRVQSRKADQAQQVAQLFSENTRLKISQLQTWTYSTTASITNASPTLSYAPTGAIPPLDQSTLTVSQVAAPTALCADLTACNSTDWFTYDLDQDSTPDFYVQVFRVDDVQVPSTNEVIGFDMGVRVYDAESADYLGSLETDKQSIGLTSGLGNLKQPLAVVYTSAYRGEDDSTLVGLKPCTVDDVVGSPETNAITTLETNFSYSVVEDGDADTDVSAQNPEAGSEVPCGIKVEISR